MKRTEIAKAGVTARLIEQIYAQNTQDSYVRELSQNAMDEGKRGFKKGKYSKDKPFCFYWGYVRFRDKGEDYIPKQAIMDTGFSFTKDDMIEQFETFGTTHKDNPDENFGHGGKTSVLPGNSYGAIFICYTEKDGNFATIYHKDEKSKQYVMSEIEWKELKRMILIPKELSDPILGEGGSKHGTIVVLLGKGEKDDTMARIDSVTGRPRPYHWVAKYLNTRYVSFPDYIKTKSLPRLMEKRKEKKAHLDKHSLLGISKLYDKRYAIHSGTVDIGVGDVHWVILDKTKIKNDSHGNSWKIGGGIFIGDEIEIYDAYEKKERAGDDEAAVTSERQMCRLEDSERIYRQNVDDVYRSFEIVYGKKYIVLHVALRNTMPDLSRSGIKFTNGHKINPSMLGREFSKKMPPKLVAFMNGFKGKSTLCNQINKERESSEKWLEMMKCLYTDDISKEKMVIGHNGDFKGKVNGYKDCTVSGKGSIDAITTTSAQGKRNGAKAGDSENNPDENGEDVSLQKRGTAHINIKRPKHPQSYRGVSRPLVEADSKGETVDADKFATWVEKSTLNEKPKFIYSQEYSGYKWIISKLRDCIEFKATLTKIYEVLHKEVTEFFMETHASLVGIGKKDKLKNNDNLTLLFDAKKFSILTEAKRAFLRENKKLPNAMKKGNAKQKRTEKEAVLA